MSVLRLITVVAVTALLALPTAAIAGGTVRAAGPLTDLQPLVSNATDGAAARAQVTQRAKGSVVVFTVTGLAASAEGETFGAHVHVGPCVAGDGAAAGPHFNIGGAASPATEVWLDFTVSGGAGSAIARVPFFVPAGGAQSIVIHAEETDTAGGAGARQACLGLAL